MAPRTSREDRLKAGRRSGRDLGQQARGQVRQQAARQGRAHGPGPVARRHRPARTLGVALTAALWLAVTAPGPAPAAAAAIPGRPPSPAPATAGRAHSAAPAAAVTTAGTAGVRREPGQALGAVTRWSADRLAVGDLVAAAKWHTGRPVADPARERVVLDAAADRAAAAGLDPDRARAVARDQIEAGKSVQRALLRHWRRHPSHAPADRPDLAVLRTRIDRADRELTRALADSTPLRTSAACRPLLTADLTRTRLVRQWDAVHYRALVHALASVCEPPPHPPAPAGSGGTTR
ncbi:gamma subclass chorismate mutase AroQ [Streptomyces sp. NPDC059740]|uniref:gamma subclass chorismate mutase AroQ n=1 Tax=Streptomyces sp. NPDC059740 TaxID=3346926 RepID=UPI0036646E1D